MGSGVRRHSKNGDEKCPANVCMYVLFITPIYTCALSNVTMLLRARVLMDKHALRRRRRDAHALATNPILRSQLAWVLLTRVILVLAKMMVRSLIWVWDSYLSFDSPSLPFPSTPLSTSACKHQASIARTAVYQPVLIDELVKTGSSQQERCCKTEGCTGGRLARWVHSAWADVI